LVSNTEKIMCN